MDASNAAGSKLLQVRDLSVNVQIHSLEMMEFGDQLKNLPAQRLAHFKWHRSGVFIKLPDFVSGLGGIFLDANLDKFRRTGLENAPVGKPVPIRGRRAKGRNAANDQKHQEQGQAA